MGGDFDLSGDASLAELVDRLHAELEATEELPVDREAGRWVGEAQAVAAGVANGDVAEAVVRERVGHVLDLLDHVETTGHGEADDHVETARRLAVEVTERGVTDDC